MIASNVERLSVMDVTNLGHVVCVEIVRGVCEDCEKCVAKKYCSDGYQDNCCEPYKQFFSCCNMCIDCNGELCNCCKELCFFCVFCCGGKTQIRLKDQYHIGVSHTRLVLLNTSGFSRAQRCLIGTTCAKYPFG